MYVIDVLSSWLRNWNICFCTCVHHILQINFRLNKCKPTLLHTMCDRWVAFHHLRYDIIALKVEAREGHGPLVLAIWFFESYGVKDALTICIHTYIYKNIWQRLRGWGWGVYWRPSSNVAVLVMNWILVVTVRSKYYKDTIWGILPNKKDWLHTYWWASGEAEV